MKGRHDGRANSICLDYNKGSDGGIGMSATFHLFARLSEL